MTPEERQQMNEMQRTIEDLKIQVESLQTMNNIDAIQNIKERIVRRRADVDTSGTPATNGILREISTAGSTADVLDYPDDFIEIDYNGRIYKVPSYDV